MFITKIRAEVVPIHGTDSAVLSLQCSGATDITVFSQTEASVLII